MKLLLELGADVSQHKLKKLAVSTLVDPISHTHTHTHTHTHSHTTPQPDAVNAYGCTPLHVACNNGHDVVADILLLYKVHICVKVSVM